MSDKHGPMPVHTPSPLSPLGRLVQIQSPRLTSHKAPPFELEGFLVVVAWVTITTGLAAVQTFLRGNWTGKPLLTAS